MSQAPEKERDPYIIGYGRAAMTWLEDRTIQSHAAFLLPHLRPGMSLLDCGCGPGFITLGLAEIVAPGQVTAVDIEASQVEAAAQAAAEKGMSNITFEQASIYNLPYEDNSFDACFESAVLGNLEDPQKGVDELYRVLKPGGVIGIREFDHGGDIFYPLDDVVKKSVRLYRDLRSNQGQDPYGGRLVRSYLNTAGFSSVESGATFENFDPAVYAAGSVALFEAEMGAQMVELGWLSREEIGQIIQAWEALADNPDAFIATSWIHALGRK